MMPAPGKQRPGKLIQTHHGSPSLRKTGVPGASEETPGEKRVTWDGRNNQGSRVSTGVYFYRTDAPGHTKTQKMVLTK
jgi:flagellar hook assembly protein FlgD